MIGKKIIRYNTCTDSSGFVIWLKNCKLDYMRSSVKYFVLVIFLHCGFNLSAQLPSNSDSLKLYQGREVSIYPEHYMREYYRLKKLIEKVYPYALYAADVLDEINSNAAAIEKRRKQNKFYKDAYQQLKEDFKYFIYELYTSEGRMLMKLIHRETGLTVYEIANQYRGKRNAEMFELMAKIWDQDIHIKFDATGVDKIAEHVINDMKEGILPFSNEIDIMSKEEYKIEQEKDKQRKKSNKEKKKQYEKDKKEKEKQARKQERKNK